MRPDPQISNGDAGVHTRIAVECPGCGRGNNCDSDIPESCECSRCGCDLTPLAKVAHCSHSLSASASMALRRGEYEDAMDLALRSWELKHHAAAARVGLLASLALGEVAAASSWSASLGGVELSVGA